MKRKREGRRERKRKEREDHLALVFVLSQDQTPADFISDRGANDYATGAWFV